MTQDETTVNRAVGGAVDLAEEPLAHERLGRFIVLERAGSGGMGVVYRAYDPRLRREVALKVLHRRGGYGGAHERLLREAQAMAQLSHPNVMPVYDAESVGDDIFVTMEFVEGETFSVWLRKDRGWRDALPILRAAGEGLRAAHHVGLVHRDFKPSNVLVGNDGRVRVTDFGLAESAHDPSTDPPPGVEPETGENPSSTDTRSGAIRGTPAYMAPEQHRGAAPDPKCDQFSFCAAAYEALYGLRPFGNGSFDELLFRKAKQEFQRPPAEADVPRWLHRTIVRGMSPEPEARWPSMDALLRELGRDRWRRRRQVAVAAAIFLPGVAAGLALTLGDDSVDCEADDPLLSAVWNDTRREAIDRAFSGSSVAFAATAQQRVHRRIDMYAKQWISARRDACEATHLRHEQSPELMDRRVACLHRQLGGLDGLVDVLGQADADVVRNAVSAAAGLPNPADCGDASYLLAELEPPADETAAQRVEEERARTERARALVRAGKISEAHSLALDVQRRADELSYAPLRAEVLGELADIAEKLAEYRQAEDWGRSGYMLAISIGHDRIAADIALNMTHLVGNRLARPAEGLLWAAHARALQHRFGANPLSEARVSAAEGGVLHTKGDYAEALSHLEAALSVLEAQDADPLELSSVLNLLGVVHMDEGRYSDAVARYERSAELTRSSLGDDHPSVGGRLLNLGGARAASGDPGLGEADYTAALRLFEASLGPTHPNALMARANLAFVHFSRGELEDALSRYVALEASFGASELAGKFEHVGVVVNRARVLEKMGRTEEALQHFGRAETMLIGSFGDRHPMVAEILLPRGDVHFAHGDLRSALADYQRADEIATEALPEGSDKRVRNVLRLARVWEKRRRPEVMAQRLEAMLEETKGSETLSDTYRAELRFRLAQALARQPAQADRVAVLVAEAKMAIAKVGPELRASLEAEIERWEASQATPE